MEYFDPLAYSFIVMQAVVILWCLVFRMFFLAFLAIMALTAVLLAYTMAPIGVA